MPGSATAAHISSSEWRRELVREEASSTARAEHARAEEASCRQRIDWRMASSERLETIEPLRTDWRQSDSSLPKRWQTDWRHCSRREQSH